MHQGGFPTDMRHAQQKLNKPSVVSSAPSFHSTRKSSENNKHLQQHAAQPADAQPAPAFTPASAVPMDSALTCTSCRCAATAGASCKLARAPRRSRRASQPHTVHSPDPSTPTNPDRTAAPARYIMPCTSCRCAATAAASARARASASVSLSRMSAGVPSS